MTAASALSEALVLGLASGPACLASCGPVVVPSLLAERTGRRVNVRYLSLFLTTRLAGYLLFATAAWELGTLVSPQGPTRGLLFAGIHLLLGGVLLWYAYSVGRVCVHSAAGPQLVTIGGPKGHRVPGVAALGFLTGISLCPPFVAAGVRAAETSNLAAALLFFVVFFLGTSVWMVPFAGLGWVRRNEAVTTVARMAMGLIALYYILTGVAMLAGSKSYGY